MAIGLARLTIRSIRARAASPMIWLALSHVSASWPDFSPTWISLTAVVGTKAPDASARDRVAPSRTRRSTSARWRRHLSLPTAERASGRALITVTPLPTRVAKIPVNWAARYWSRSIRPGMCLRPRWRRAPPASLRKSAIAATGIRTIAPSRIRPFSVTAEDMARTTRVRVGNFSSWPAKIGSNCGTTMVRTSARAIRVAISTAAG